MKKTNKKIFIIIIVIAIIFVIGGVAFTFLSKTNNKDEFLKCAEQIFDSENGFIDNRLKLLSDKKKATQYENIGKIKFNVDNENINSKVSEEINNNFNISFAGNVDNSNEMTEYLVKLNYSKNVNFPIFYKKVGKLQGVKSDKIYKNYFVTEKNNITSLFSKESIEYDDIGYNEETNIQSDFQNKFINILNNDFKENSFSKVSTQQEEGYVLDVEGDKLKGLLEELLDVLKSDEKILDSLNLKRSYIDLLKNGSINNDMLDDKASITLYQKDGKLNRIVLEINGLFKFDVKKLQKGETLNYNISITSNKNADIITFNLDIDLDGLSELETIEEVYKIDLGFNDYNYNFEIENKINFTNVEIEKFAEGEYTNIDKLSATKQQQILQLIGTKFIQGNLELMKQFGINNQNILLSVLPNNEFANYEENIENKDDKEEQENQNDETNTTSTTNKTNGNTVGNTIGNSTSNTIGNTTTNNTSGNTTRSDLATSFSETEKKIFNENFEKYTGYNMDGNRLKSALMEVIANNMSDEERQIKVTGVVTLTGNEVPDGIETQKKYRIKLKYSDNGFVNEMIVSEGEE